MTTVHKMPGDVSRLTAGQFPYIDFEAKTYLERKTGRDIPTDEKTPHFKKMLVLHDTYPTYTGSAGLQAPSTLDSSYYDMLSEKKLRIRDEDQVMLKWFEKKTKRKKESDYLDAILSYFRNRISFDSTEGHMLSDNGDDEALMSSTGSELDPTSSFSTVKPPDTIPGTTAQPPKIPVKDGAKKKNVAPKMLMIHQLWLWKLCDSTSTFTATKYLIRQ